MDEPDKLRFSKQTGRTWLMDGAEAGWDRLSSM